VTGPEIMRAFKDWSEANVADGFWSRLPGPAYPLYLGISPSNGRWYVRERMPGTRVWRAEEDGGFTLLGGLSLATVANPCVNCFSAPASVGALCERCADGFADAVAAEGR